MSKHDDDLSLKAKPMIPTVGLDDAQGSDPMHEQMMSNAIHAMSQRILELEAINAALLAACEANQEFQNGMHSNVDEICELAEKCRRLTDVAIAAAKGKQ